MFASGLRQFYIDELCQLADGRFVVPHDWVIRNKQLTARCSCVSLTNVSQVVLASYFSYTKPISEWMENHR